MIFPILPKIFGVSENQARSNQSIKWFLYLLWFGRQLKANTGENVNKIKETSSISHCLNIKELALEMDMGYLTEHLILIKQSFEVNLISKDCCPTTQLMPLTKHLMHRIPCRFFLLPKLKLPLRGRHCKFIEDIKPN